MRILWAISGIGRGHVARCRPLLAELAARGHRSLAAVPGARAAAALADVCEVRMPPPGYRERVAPPPAQRPPYLDVHDTEATLSAYQRDPADGLAATIAFLDAALDEAEPDLVVVDQIMGAAPLARTRGLPVVQVTHPPMLPGHGPWARWAPQRDPRTRVPPAGPALAAAFAAVGAEPAPRDVEDLLAGDLVVVPSAPAFGTCPGALHVAPADELGDLPAPPPAPAGGAPRVAVYLGGGAEPLAPEVVRGVLAAGARALVLAGDRLALPGELAGDPRVTITGPVRMDAALAGCRAVVHHGGSGTAHAALLAGVPAVAIPTNTEQELNARTVAELGAGRHVPVSPRPLEPFAVTPAYTTLAHREVVALAERLAAALAELLADPAAPAAARRAGEEIAALPPIARAADAVEALVGVAR